MTRITRHRFAALRWTGPIWWWWLAMGQWRRSPGRTLTCVASIAIGVSLALAIHLINHSALEEFRQAMASVNGQAHAQLRALRTSFSEQTWERLLKAQVAGLEAVSPVLEAEVALEAESTHARGPATADAAKTSGDPADKPQRNRIKLRLVAVDVLAAGEVSPGLLPGADTGSLLEAHTVALSDAALKALNLRVGQTLLWPGQAQPTPLRIVGTLPPENAAVPMAVMDLANAQWLLGRSGQLSRLDLRVSPGADLDALKQTLNTLGQNEWVWSTATDATERMSNLSRAYRVNLSVLALVALFTGAFLVFSTLALAVARQTPELALLGVLGANARQRVAAVLMQGLALGVAGAVLGVGAGVALAQTVLGLVGGDLGGGYFEGVRPRLHLDALSLIAFGLLGILTGAAGAWLPARAVGRMPAARSLRSARDDLLLRGLDRPFIALALAALGSALLALPAVADLPLPAYAAIALWLVAGIASLPSLVGWLTRLVQIALERRAAGRVGGISPPAWLALQRATQTPGALAAGLAGVVASVALAAAMGIMVHSFRESVSQWLDQVLPAPLYGRLDPDATDRTAADGLAPGLLALIRSHPDIARVQGLRTVELQADPAAPSIALLVRHTDPGAPVAELPLTGPRQDAPPGLIPIWASEPLASRWSIGPGSRLEIDPLRIDPQGRFFVVGVWRDYARQHGALAIDAHRWVAIGGDDRITDLAVWPAEGRALRDLPQALESIDPRLSAVQWRSADEIRALSMRIFDRSFAVTYALEAVALLVGLFGVAAACSSDALSRIREFGMLRHVGLPARAARTQLMMEAVLGTAVALLWGSLLGAAIGWVLIARVNPQSFHWTMQMHIPWSLLLGASVVLLAGAALSAYLASRPVVGRHPIHAIRQDT